MTKLERLIQLGKEQEGYIEKASADYLYDKTANKGSANFTKYSKDVNDAGLEGCQAQPWCCTFQFWLDLKTLGKDEALKRWHMTKAYVGYNCFSTYNKFQAAGKITNMPVLGAVVIFTYSHAGRVIRIYEESGVKYFDCLEGNTSSNLNDRNGGMVKIKKRMWNDPTIKGFCIIDYEEQVNHDYPAWVKSNGIWYYRLDEGVNAHGWNLINHHWYYFAEDGAMQTGSVWIGDEPYYLWEKKDALEGACCNTDSRGVLSPWYV